MGQYTLALLSLSGLNSEKARAVSSILNSGRDILLIVDKRTMELIRSLGLLGKGFRGEIIVFEKRASEEKVLEILSSYIIEEAFVCVEDGELGLFAEIVNVMNVPKTRC